MSSELSVLLVYTIESHFIAMGGLQTVRPYRRIIGLEHEGRIVLACDIGRMAFRSYGLLEFNPDQRHQIVTDNNGQLYDVVNEYGQIDRAVTPEILHFASPDQARYFANYFSAVIAPTTTIDPEASTNGSHNCFTTALATYADGKQRMLAEADAEVSQFVANSRTGEFPLQTGQLGILLGSDPLSDDGTLRPEHAIIGHTSTEFIETFCIGGPVGITTYDQLRQECNYSEVRIDDN